jgi:NAD(P)-dependent dehydrogenase (short-subunit alcohol dehydrogenase family)
MYNPARLAFEQPMQEFADKVAIVTGTSGIGRAVALRLAAGGARVLACGIDSSANAGLQTEATSSNLPVEVQPCDVSSAQDVNAAVSNCVRLFGGVDILVNSAAIHPYGTVIEIDFEVWSRCLAVNVTGIFLFARTSIPEMKKRGGGAIVNIASVQGHACQRGVAAYVASKGAILSLTRALALDHAGDGIRVNSISPGSVATPMLELAARTFSPDLPVEEVFKRFGDAHPLRRIGIPEEIAEMAAFLVSSKAGFCTGADYLVDGGLLAGVAVK